MTKPIYIRDFQKLLKEADVIWANWPNTRRAVKWYRVDHESVIPAKYLDNALRKYNGSGVEIEIRFVDTRTYHGYAPCRRVVDDLGRVKALTFRRDRSRLDLFLVKTASLTRRLDVEKEKAKKK